MAQDIFRRFAKKGAAAEGRTRAIWGAMAFQFVVAVYGGFFGAGIGILMLASLGFLGMTNIHEMNVLKTVLGALINAVATIWFIRAGTDRLGEGGDHDRGALVGYYFTAHMRSRFLSGGCGS